MAGQAPPKPEQFPGTDIEWMVYWALTVPLKKKDGIDFDFQSSIFGGRSQLGGLVIDFLMIDGSGIGMDILGEHWHYGTAEELNESMVRRERAGQYGIELIFIDGEDVARSPVYYVREALNGVDHSRVGRL